MPKVRGPGNVLTQGLPNVPMDVMGGYQAGVAPAVTATPEPSRAEETITQSIDMAAEARQRYNQQTDTINTVVPAVNVVLRDNAPNLSFLKR